ncbi:response regulator transcription factor [Pseudofrankia sp. EUN1h]|uniref:response regulator transcription factor n=1 Tax=Pseudofrankia sp. EUN1h TaxID=1834515 RepID=UPI001E54EC07|nr:MULTISPECIES: LuxR C-terminal-related transcriptional regulator [Pseudofrankia]
MLTDYRDRSAGNGPGEPGRVDCGEHVSSVLAIPLRLGGRALCVFYLAERSKKSISAATTKFALTFVRQFEIAVAQVTKTYETDAPRRWNVDERVLRQVDDELVALSLDVAATPALVRIATIRNLLEDSVLKSLSAVDSVNSLTRRELDVLELVAEGLSNTEAAERLVISPETVKSYLRTIRSKLGVHNRTAAVDLARRSGLLR